MTATAHDNFGYFVDKARDVFAGAGGNPDLSGPLAEWASKAREAGDPRVGVIVAEDGTIIARTRHTPGNGSTTCGGTYVYRKDTARGEGGIGEILDRAMARLAHEHDQPMIHVRYWEVCQGAGKFAGRGR
jgi:hypothetical protein